MKPHETQIPSVVHCSGHLWIWNFDKSGSTPWSHNQRSRSPGTKRRITEPPENRWRPRPSAKETTKENQPENKHGRWKLQNPWKLIYSIARNKQIDPTMSLDNPSCSKMFTWQTVCPGPAWKDLSASWTTRWAPPSVFFWRCLELCGA